MLVIKRIRLRLPQSGGDNLWHLIKRIFAIFKLRAIGRDRLAGIVKKHGLEVKWPPRFAPKTTYSGHGYAVRENLFKSFKTTAPGQALVADITYLSVGLGHAYLFLVTDAHTRMVVGHVLSENLGHEGAIRALKQSLKHLPEIKGVIHHSDRGAQYCCHNFLDEIQKWDMKSSMTDADHCAQNALAECMNSILKREFLLGCHFPCIQTATLAVEQAIETYNYIRIHGSLNGKTPAEEHHGDSSEFNSWAKNILPSNVCIPERATL